MLSKTSPFFLKSIYVEKRRKQHSYCCIISFYSSRPKDKSAGKIETRGTWAYGTVLGINVTKSRYWGSSRDSTQSVSPLETTSSRETMPFYNAHFDAITVWNFHQREGKPESILFAWYLLFWWKIKNKRWDRSSRDLNTECWSGREKKLITVWVVELIHWINLDCPKTLDLILIETIYSGAR